VKDRAHWWQGILARSLFSVIGIALLLGGASGLTVSESVGTREHQQAVESLGELLDTVVSTASIASFAKDEQLAAEVAQGLMRNRDVQRVVIRSGDKELARAERDKKNSAAPSKLGVGRMALPGSVKRPLLSPFKSSEVVGEIELDVDWAAIEARVAKIARDTVLLLMGQLTLVVVAVAAMMFYLVVRPIKATSDRLHRLDATSGQPLIIPDGHENSEIGRLVGDINDLTGRLFATLEQERGLQQQQTIAQRKYQDLFENATSGIFVADRDGWLESFNRAFVDLTWLPLREEKIGRRLTETGWREPQHLLDLLRTSLDEAADDAIIEDDFLLVGRRGDERWLHVSLMPLGNGNVQGTIIDVTQRKNEELSARRLAVTDALTGFANRAGLLHALSGMTGHTPAFVLAMLDLDGFKQVNDALGFPAGDQLLLMVAARIRAFLRPGEHAARLGGDEFALVLSDGQSRQDLDEHIGRLLAQIGQPYALTGPNQPGEVLIGASIGIALYPADGDDLHQLLRGAELALNHVRAAGGHNFSYFDPALLAAVEHRRRLEDDLRHALSAGELSLAFQPIVDLVAGRLAGAEALLRWTHPVRGMVSPEVFIPLAEEIGLIGEIGLMVLGDTCRQVAEWRRAGLDMYVSVNVSVKQIPLELPVLVVTDFLREHGLEADAIAIEITEGVLMSNVATAQTWIESLRAAGLRIYLDDFGTGYSSLSYLKRFPMDTVKIDKSFIRDMGVDSNDRALVNAIITMAKSLGLNVVAEGVEDEQQLMLLRDMGCGYGQGYYFSRPIPAAEFAATAQRINETLFRATPVA